PTGSKWAKLLGHRFSTVFPPFSTVLPGGPNQHSFEESRVRPCSAPLRTVENGESGGVPLGRLQRLGDRVLDTLEPDELHRLAHFFRDVLEVAAVARRQHHALQPSAVGGDDLLLDAADRQNQAAQADLARHGGVTAYGAACEQ